MSTEGRCPVGFGGDKCELRCTLDCQHGGTCVFDGDAFYGQRDSMSCDCPRDRAGRLCEARAELCGGTTHATAELVCLHGATCKQQKGSNEYECVCPDDNIECQERRSATWCTPEPPHVEYSRSMAVPAFCVNGGTCQDQIIDGGVYPGCECPPLFTGPHCEFLKTMDIEPITRHSPFGSGVSLNLSGYYHAMFWILVTGISLVAGLFVIRQVRRIRRRRRAAQDGLERPNIQSFRGEDGRGQVNRRGELSSPVGELGPSALGGRSRASARAAQAIREAAASRGGLRRNTRNRNPVRRVSDSPMTAREMHHA